MGMFSWMYADTNNKKSLKVGGKAYVPCPNGEIIVENYYDGYGHFQGYDIYDLVADWNKNHISDKNIKKPVREDYPIVENGNEYFKFAMENYAKKVKRIIDFAILEKSDEYMMENYGEDWKREIGIDIACYDEDNEKLKYPIKICMEKPKRYDFVPASNGDPNPGC